MRRIVVAGALLAIVGASLTQASAAYACTQEEYLLKGQCSELTATNTSTGTTLSGTQTTTDTTRKKTKTDDVSRTDIPTIDIDTTTKIDDDGYDDGQTGTPSNCLHKTGICFTIRDDEEEEEEDDEVEIGIDDLDEFLARSGSDHMQPNGWMVAGLPTNFYSTAAEHVVEGELLGIDADVRFTPVAWHWDFGDGEQLNLDTGGLSWEQLGLPEFSPTPTSHVFAAGTFVITLTVDYAAAYNLDGGDWVAVDGVVSLDSDPIEATSGSATTVLVGAECVAGSRAPGC